MGRIPHPSLVLFIHNYYILVSDRTKKKKEKVPTSIWALKISSPPADPLASRDPAVGASPPLNFILFLWIYSTFFTPVSIPAMVYKTPKRFNDFPFVFPFVWILLHFMRQHKASFRYLGQRPSVSSSASCFPSTSIIIHKTG